MLSEWSRSLLASSLLLLIILLSSLATAFQNKRYTQQRKITSSPRNMSAFIHHVDDDDDIKQQLSNSPLSLVVAVASFAPKSTADYIQCAEQMVFKPFYSILFLMYHLVSSSSSTKINAIPTQTFLKYVLYCSFLSPLIPHPHHHDFIQLSTS